jgi:hypothetical protein
MRLTIIRSDNAVGIDGEFLTVDCSALPANFHALQWSGPENGVGGDGEAEWSGKPKPANTEVVDLGEYSAYVEAWRSEQARIEAEIARAAAEAEAARLAAKLAAAKLAAASAAEGPAVL